MAPLIITLFFRLAILAVLGYVISKFLAYSAKKLRKSKHKRFWLVILIILLMLYAKIRWL